jgi:hypothetical protein
MASVQADAVYLNGALLSVDPSTGMLPQNPLPGRSVSDGSPLVAPGYSYGFVVLNAAAAAACQ